MAGRNGELSYLFLGEYSNIDHLARRIKRYCPKGRSFSLLQKNTELFSNTEKELREYFAGTKKIFTVPINLTGTTFQIKVWRELAKIPYGKRETYGGIARKVGNPQGARAVGGAVHTNPISIIIPCHRIVSQNGLGGFAVGLEFKRRLLAIEEI